jgi:glycine cleavage system H lipoate-binding protein
VGGDLPFFLGKQYGSGWLRTIAKFAFPVLKRILGVATNTADDVIMKDKNFVSSLGKNAVSEINNLMTGKTMSINEAAKKSKAKVAKLDTAGTIFDERKK